MSAALTRLLESLVKLFESVDWVGVADGLASFAIGTANFINIAGGLTNIVDIAIAAWIASLIGGLVGLVPTVVALAAALFGLELAAAPITAVILAVAALAAGAYMLVRHWQDVTKFFGDLWNWMKATLKWSSIFGPLIQAAELITANWSQIVSFFGSVWGGIKNAFKAGVDAVWNILPEWFRSILKGTAFVLDLGIKGLNSALNGSSAGPGPTYQSRAPRSVGYQGQSQKFTHQIDLSVKSQTPVSVDHMNPSSGVEFNVDRGNLVLP